ncbi:MAG: hypothetical protein JWL77_2482 [Chthonomonadaceae bacterium]|nr:hypothetical protein [Chthonomonadaceae bacterium]
MSMTISIPDNIAHAVEDLVARSGKTPERLILEAIGAHFPPIPVELLDEFEALERASDEDFVRFEQQEQV